MVRRSSAKSLEDVIENYTLIIEQLKSQLEKEHTRAEHLKRKQEEYQSTIQDLESQVATITQLRNEERRAYLADLDVLRNSLGKSRADLQVTNAKLFQASMHERDAVEQRLVRRMSSMQLAKLLQNNGSPLQQLPGQDQNPLSSTGVPKLWMNAPKTQGRPHSAMKSAASPAGSKKRPASALSISRTSSASASASTRDNTQVRGEAGPAALTASFAASKLGGAGAVTVARGAALEEESAGPSRVESAAAADAAGSGSAAEQSEEGSEEARAVVTSEWLLTMEGILAQSRGLLKRNLSLVTGSAEEMPRIKIWGTDPAMYLHSQPMTIKHHRRAVYDAVGKALRGQAEAPELLLAAVDSVSAHHRKRQVREIGEMLRVLGSTLKVMDALLTSLLAPRPSATTIQHYARALKQAFGCEAVRLFRVDADTQEVLSMLPPAPGSDGQADHYSLSESGIVPFVVREKVLLNIPYPASSYAYFDGVRDALPGAKHKLVDNMLCCPIYAPAEAEEAVSATRTQAEQSKAAASPIAGMKKERRRLFATPDADKSAKKAPASTPAQEPRPTEKPMWAERDQQLSFGKGAENDRCIAVLQLFNKKGADFDMADEHLAFTAAGGLGPLIGSMQRRREEGELLEGASCLTTATQEFAPERDLLGRAVSQLLRSLKSVLRGRSVELWLVRHEVASDRTYLAKLRDVLGTKETEPGVRGERVYVHEDADAPEELLSAAREARGVGRAVIRSVAEQCKESETPHEVAVPVVGQGGSCMGVIECTQRHSEEGGGRKNLEDDDAVSDTITAQDVQLLKMIGREIGRALESSTHFCLAVPPPPSHTVSSVVHIMQGVLRSTATITRAERVTVYTIDRKGDLCLRPSKDLHGAQSVFSLDFGQGIPGASAKHNRVVRVPMAKLHRWYHSSYDAHFAAKTEALVCCPIHAPCSGVILGAVEVANKIEGGLAFTTVDEVFIRAASDQLGRLMVLEEANSSGLPVREVLEDQRRRQEEDWAAETAQRIFRAYRSRRRVLCDAYSAALHRGWKRRQERRQALIAVGFVPSLRRPTAGVRVACENAMRGCGGRISSML